MSWAYSLMVERRVRIAVMPVRLRLGPPDRKLQAKGGRLASLGNQIIRFSGRKNQLAILLFGKRKF